MSVREFSYYDYGMKSEDVKKVLDYCRSESFKEYELLVECAFSANRYLAKRIVDSILHKSSYEKETAKSYIPATKVDFYSYRRLCIALFWKEIRKRGIKL